MFRFPLFRFLAVFASVAAVALLSACDPPNPAEDPVIKAKLDKIESLEDKLKGLDSLMTSLEDDMMEINGEVTDLTRKRSATTGASTELGARLSAQEKETRRLASEVVSLRKALDALKAAPKPGRAAPPKVSSQTPKAGSAAPPAVRNPNPRAKGSFYTVKVGETIDTIAAANGLTATALRKANNLPGTVGSLKPGVRLFVPRP